MTTSPNPDDNVLCIARDWVAAVESTDPMHECVIMGKHILAAHEVRERARREMPEVVRDAAFFVEVATSKGERASDVWRYASALIVAHEELAELRAELSADEPTLRGALDERERQLEELRTELAALRSERASAQLEVVQHVVDRPGGEAADTYQRAIVNLCTGLKDASWRARVERALDERERIERATPELEPEPSQNSTAFNVGDVVEVVDPLASRRGLTGRIVNFHRGRSCVRFENGHLAGYADVDLRLIAAAEESPTRGADDVER